MVNKIGFFEEAPNQESFTRLACAFIIGNAIIMGMAMLVAGLIRYLADKDVETLQNIAVVVGGFLSSQVTLAGAFKIAQKAQENQAKATELKYNTDTGDNLSVDTFYRVGDDVIEDGKKYVCIKEFLTTQTLTLASVDSEHWKIA